MKSILVLGAGVMQEKAIKISKEKGFSVHVADGSTSAVNIPLADFFHHIDLKDIEALVETAKTIPDLKAVFTAGTDFSASVAYVAEKLGLPGIPYEAALNASDKARMRSCLEKAAVPVPLWATGNLETDPFSILPKGSSFPYVVKPVDNMGARGCRLVRTKEELQNAWLLAAKSSRTQRAIIEEYLDGPEFSIDAVIQNSKITIRGIADRKVQFEPYFIEMGHTIPSSYGEEVINEVLDVFEKGALALGIINGAAKGDIKYTRRGAFVGEIAARLSGGYMSSWTYPYSSGIEPTAEAIDIASGENVIFAEPKLKLVCAERAWISIPGKVQSVMYPETKNPAIKDVFPRVAEGSTVVFPRNNVEKCGNVIAVASTTEEAELIAEDYARNVLVRLQPHNLETEAYLAGKDREYSSESDFWPPIAFPNISAIVKASLDSMPEILRNEAPYLTIGIAPLLGYKEETERDWQDRTLADALACVTKLTGAKINKNADIVLGSVFWKALINGSYQAAAFIVDSYKIH